MRLAHYSDIHVTIAPLRALPEPLIGKRLAGALNYYAGGRRRHFAGVEARIEALLRSIEEARPDHALCTGDVTQMSYEVELDRAARLFGPRLHDPARHTVLPGNHDRYTRASAAEGRFERVFGAVTAKPGAWPLVKRLAPAVTLVALDTARPTGLFDSSGRVGADQLARTRAILSDPTLKDEYVILALHYALYRASGRLDRPSHGLRDAGELLRLIDDPALHLDLVLHGHLHRAFTSDRARRPIVCAGSATDLAARPAPGYNLLTIDPAARTHLLERRTWNEARHRYL